MSAKTSTYLQHVDIGAESRQRARRESPHLGRNDVALQEPACSIERRCNSQGPYKRRWTLLRPTSLVATASLHVRIDFGQPRVLWKANPWYADGVDVAEWSLGWCKEIDFFVSRKLCDERVSTLLERQRRVTVAMTQSGGSVASGNTTPWAGRSRRCWRWTWCW